MLGYPGDVICPDAVVRVPPQDELGDGLGAGDGEGEGPSEGRGLAAAEQIGTEKSTPRPQ